MLAAAVAVSVILGGAVALARVVPEAGRAQPAATGTPSTAGSPSPSPSPSASPFPSPVPSFGPWPVVELGGDVTPYTGDRSGPKTIIAYGTVDGIPWSEFVYHDVTGRCLALFMEKDGGSFCPDTTPRSPPGMVMYSIASGKFGPIGYWGDLAPTVARLEVHVDGGEVRPVEIFPEPTGGDARYFVVFPPPRTPGTVWAIDAQGNVVGRASLCAWDTQAASNTSINHLCLN